MLKGTNFDSINASSTSADIKAYLGQNSKKILWDVDINSDSVAAVNYFGSDIDSAVVPTNEQMTITLSDAKASALEGTSGYALSTTDQVVIQTGFFGDTYGNIGAEAEVTKNVNFADTVAPTIASVTTTTASGTYGSTSAAIPITVTFNEAIKSGSSMTVVLNTNKTVELTYTSPNKLEGSYSIGASDTVTGLDIQDITNSTVDVADLYGNVVASTLATPGPSSKFICI